MKIEGYKIDEKHIREQLKKAYYQLSSAINNVQIAANILRYDFGIKVIRADGITHDIQLDNGIDVLAEVVGAKIKTKK